MDIKEEIALKLQATDRFRLNVSELSAIEFAEALIAEVVKGNEPCAFLHEWIEYHPFGDTFAGEPCTTITNDEKPFDSSDTVSPLFTFPPTAKQIANETAWRPIETAPNDGTEFLTYCQSYANKWWLSTGKCNLNGATHWMPLPKPPAIDTAVAKGEQE